MELKLFHKMFGKTASSSEALSEIVRRFRDSTSQVEAANGSRCANWPGAT
jgi:hypothetical protein